MKLLIIEDDPGLSDALCQTFKSEKHMVTPCYDGVSGLDEAMTGTYDAIILDIMLPLMDGFTLLTKLREAHIHTPVLMLTARSDLESRIKGLDSGADYYLTKPFETDELLACVRAITRRPDVMNDTEPSFGDIIVRSGQGGIECTSSKRFVKLGAKELLLIETLVNNRGNIVSRENLIEKIWGMDSNSEYNNIEVYVSFVRKKLSFLDSKVTIRSKRGLGYMLEANE